MDVLSQQCRFRSGLNLCLKFDNLETYFTQLWICNPPANTVYPASWMEYILLSFSIFIYSDVYQCSDPAFIRRVFKITLLQLLPWMKAEPEQFRLNNFLRVQTKQLSLEYELKTRRSAKKKQNKTKWNQTSMWFNTTNVKCYFAQVSATFFWYLVSDQDNTVSNLFYGYWFVSFSALLKRGQPWIGLSLLTYDPVGSPYNGLHGNGPPERGTSGWRYCNGWRFHELKFERR